METKPNQNNPTHTMTIDERELWWGRKIPQEFWDTWLQCFLEDEPTPTLPQQLHELAERVQVLPPTQQNELSVLIHKAVGQWAQEKLDGLPRSEESR